MPVRKKMTPRQKQKRNRKATLAAVLCFVAAIAIVGTYTMRDYKTVKKKGARKSTTGGTEESTGGSQSEASGNAQKDSASESGTDGAGTGGKAEKSGSGAGTAGTASQKCFATAGNTDGSGNNGNQDGNSQTNGSQQAARTAGGIFRKLYKRQQDDLACKRHGAYELQHGQNSLLRDTRPIQV